MSRIRLAGGGAAHQWANHAGMHASADEVELELIQPAPPSLPQRRPPETPAHCLEEGRGEVECCGLGEERCFKVTLATVALVALALVLAYCLVPPLRPVCISFGMLLATLCLFAWTLAGDA